MHIWSHILILHKNFMWHQSTKQQKLQNLISISDLFSIHIRVVTSKLMQPWMNEIFFVSGSKIILCGARNLWEWNLYPPSLHRFYPWKSQPYEWELWGDKWNCIDLSITKFASIFKIANLSLGLLCLFSKMTMVLIFRFFFILIKIVMDMYFVYWSDIASH